MKAVLQKIGKGILLGSALLGSANVFGQIDYYENFSGDHRWTNLDFQATDVAVCDNELAFRANPVNDLGTIVPVETVSPSLGVSNGERLTLSYQYKLLRYDPVLPYQPVDLEDWGFFTVEYAPTINGPWTEIDAVTPYDHNISTDCSTRTVSFVPQADSNVYLRVFADAGTSPEVNYFIYIDEISAFQETLTIDPVVADSDFKVYPNPVENYLHLQYDGYITDVVLYNMQGQEVIVENIDRDFSRLDLSGLSHGQYVLQVVADNQLRTINVIKD